MAVAWDPLHFSFQAWTTIEASNQGEYKAAKILLLRSLQSWGGDALMYSVVKPSGAAFSLPREDFPKELYRIGEVLKFVAHKVMVQGHEEECWGI